MSNGCICCTLRDDLLAEVSRLAQEGRFDYLLIESTGISEPIPVAQTFTFEDEEGVSLSHVSRLDTMVTVVDAASFLRDYNEAESLQSRGESLGEEDTRTVTDLLIDQIEFADVIILNKLDLVTTKQAEEVEAIVKALNPVAEIIPTTQSKVPLDRVLNTNLFDYAKLKHLLVGYVNCKESTLLKPRNTESQASLIEHQGLLMLRRLTSSSKTSQIGKEFSAQRDSSGCCRPSHRIRMGASRRSKCSSPSWILVVCYATR